MNPARKGGESLRGTIIGGKYRLDSLIGEGGMATVWRAAHLTLGREVAVKFIHVTADMDDVRQRFLREAKVHASIRHRNVVDIIDFGTTPEGRPYMVMEYLEGHTLAKRLDDGPALSVADSVRIFARVLSGLAAVHDAGIIHRDIKPANVFLVQDADGEFPKLLDFGISRAADSLTGVDASKSSRDNAITGTPQYMAPEQARGGQTIDERADLWGVGVLLYETLTGQLPFDAENVGDLIVMILSSEPVSLEQLRPDLQPVSRVVHRALARERDHRFQTAREMRQALLDAAAETASTLREERHPAASALGLSDVPAARPGELYDALSQAREPNESGKMPSGSFGSLDGVQPARTSTAPTLDPPDEGEALAASPPQGGEPAGETARRRRGRGRWVALAAVLALAAGAGAVYAIKPPWVAEAVERQPWLGDVVPSEMLAPHREDEARASGRSEPQQPVSAAQADEPAADTTGQPVTVRLVGVPDEATVRVDGEPVAGSRAELPRDGEEHEIEVVAPQREPWSVVHTASRDGEYLVQLAPTDDGAAAEGSADESSARQEQRARQRRRRLRRMRWLRRKRAEEKRQDSLYEDPGF